LAMYKREIRVIWDSLQQENLFERVSIGKREVCSFPTPLFVKARVGLAERYGLAGVAIWEAGQMMATLITHI